MLAKLNDVLARPGNLCIFGYVPVYKKIDHPQAELKPNTKNRKIRSLMLDITIVLSGIQQKAGTLEVDKLREHLLCVKPNERREFA